MAFTNTGKHAMLDHVASLATHVRLLDEVGDEIEWSAASQDKEITWAAAGASEDGEIAASSQPVFDVPGGKTVGGVAFINNTGATEYARDTFAEGDRETYSNDGTYTVSTAKLIITDS